MANFNEIRSKIVERIEEKAPLLACSVCGNKSMILVDGFLKHPLTSDSSKMVIGGKSLPTIGLICSNCGHLIEFSTGVLGFLPKRNSDAHG